MPTLRLNAQCLIVQEDGAMAKLVVRLFGAMEARLEEKAIPKLWERKGDELLALLALQSDQQVSSEALSRMLWPDGDGDVDGLRHSIRTLRGKLAPFDRQILAGTHCYSFNTAVPPDCQLDIDIVTFDRVDAQSGDYSALHHAVRLCERGALLETWQQDRHRSWLRSPWFRQEQERRKAKYGEMLETLVCHCRSESVRASAAGDKQEAVRWHRTVAGYLGRLAKIAPWREAVYAEWMEEWMAAGERLEAIRLYQRYRDYLQTRHGIEPPEAMTRLLRQAMADTWHGEFAMPTLPPEPLADEAVGGAMPVDSIFYLPRPADGEFHTAIARCDRVVLLKGARQVGKTSLLMRGMEQARRAGAKVVLTNFASLTQAQLQTLDSLFLALAQSFADALKLDAAPAEYWAARRAAPENFDRYLKGCVLAGVPDRLFWAIDEADRLFTCPYKDDVFGKLRALCNERSLDPDEPIERLMVAIAYSTEPYLFISDLNLSPFNLAPSLALTDWSPAEVAQINRLCGSPLPESDAGRFYHLVGGHPFLVRRALYAMQIYRMGLGDLEAQAECLEGVFSGHLAAIYDSLIHDRELTEMLRDLLHSRKRLVERGYLRLHAAGLIVGESPEEARLRCDLYRRFLERNLP
jgi:DNA-binding SARP family transcriptional activator